VVESWLGIPWGDQTRQEADFIQESVGVPPPAQLLDVPCGGGRHSHTLAGRGYNLTAVDISSEFLDAARSAPAGPPGTIAWEHREMRDLPWPEAFDGAYCFGNSFGYLDDQGNAAFLNAVARALKPGARFVLDTSYVLEGLLPTLQERAWYPAGDCSTSNISTCATARWRSGPCRPDSIVTGRSSTSWRGPASPT
jgi:SAM-dependent methyltransferase